MRHLWRNRPRGGLLALAAVMVVATVVVLVLEALPSAGFPSQRASLETGTLSSGPGSGMLLLRMLLALSVVVGIIWLGAYVFRRYTGRGGGMPATQFRVVGCTFLGPKKAVYAVLTLDRVLILGVSDAQITLLSEIQEPERVAAFVSAPKAHGDRPFATYLNSFLKGGSVRAS